MESIGWFDAWSRWASGDPDLKDKLLWGMQILWWGRVGKFAAFVGGLTLILDIIGPERIRQATSRSAKKLREGTSLLVVGLRRANYLAVAAVVIIFLIIIPIVRVTQGKSPYVNPFGPEGYGRFHAWDWAQGALGGVAVLLALFLLPRIRRGLVWIFEHDKTAYAARMVSLALFLVGFHFDMLAS
jgi:hypothetical protein